jgi:hypothetical protein
MSVVRRLAEQCQTLSEVADVPIPRQHEALAAGLILDEHCWRISTNKWSRKSRRLPVGRTYSKCAVTYLTKRVRLPRGIRISKRRTPVKPISTRVVPDAHIGSRMSAMLWIVVCKPTAGIEIHLIKPQIYSVNALLHFLKLAVLQRQVALLWTSIALR